MVICTQENCAQTQGIFRNNSDNDFASGIYWRNKHVHTNNECWSVNAEVVFGKIVVQSDPEKLFKKSLKSNDHMEHELSNIWECIVESDNQSQFIY